AIPFGPATPSKVTNPAGAALVRRDPDAAREPINLTRVLRKYPHVDPNYTQPQGGNPAVLTSGYHSRYDSANAAIVAYRNAQSDRQTFAADIFRRLLIVTGTPAPANLTAPTDAELRSLRWLAQLSANIVDYID